MDRRGRVNGLERYIKFYYERVSENNAQQALDEFDEGWSELVAFLSDGQMPGHRSMYSSALVIFSAAINFKKDLSETEVMRLSLLIADYDKIKSTEYEFSIKQCLFLNLGCAWYKLGDSYINQAFEAIKKYVYYLIAQSSNTGYYPTAYAYKRCDKFLFQNLINEELHLASPATFNDPFDCPIYELLHTGDKISALIRNAYHYCLKIACFTSNVKLPESSPDKNRIKSNNSPDDFANPLMWAHYADSHKGVCIKYRFPNAISDLGVSNPIKASYFRDVKYSDKVLLSYTNKSSITIDDAFFLKGEAWKYENELRYLQFDLTGNSEHTTLSIPYCIETIYFGLKCSEQDKQSIMNIMTGKRFKQKDLNGDVVVDKCVEFYQMKVDPMHFGGIIAEKI